MIDFTYGDLDLFQLLGELVKLLRVDINGFRKALLDLLDIDIVDS